MSLKVSVILAAAAAVSAAILLLKNNLSHKEPGETDGEIDYPGHELESMTLTYNNAMNPEGTYSYTAEKEEGGCFLTIESLIYNDGETFRTEIPKETFDKVIEAVDFSEVYKWNGFSKSDPDVLDGYGFSMKLRYANGKTVRAQGSNSFPKGYGQFAKDIGDLFDPYREKYAYDRIPKHIDSDSISSVYVTFIKQGNSGFDDVSLSLNRNLYPGRDNVSVSVFDHEGEFLEKMERKEETLKINTVMEELDLTKLQAAVRKYELPLINGYDKTAEDYGNCEWFQIDIYYESGESLTLCGTEKFPRYDEARHDIIRSCLEAAGVEGLKE